MGNYNLEYFTQWRQYYGSKVIFSLLLRNYFRIAGVPTGRVPPSTVVGGG